jgi:hypothetical protein
MPGKRRRGEEPHGRQSLGKPDGGTRARELWRGVKGEERIAWRSQILWALEGSENLRGQPVREEVKEGAEKPIRPLAPSRAIL